jgi:hypothetical protein
MNAPVGDARRDIARINNPRAASDGEKSAEMRGPVNPRDSSDRNKR